MTREEYISHEVAIWGEDYILDLIDRGYLPVLTTAGYKWMVVSDDEYQAMTGTQRNQHLTTA
jgi:hypothetical protein